MNESNSTIEIKTGRGRKAFAADSFDNFLSSNKKSLRGIADPSEAFNIYSVWAEKTRASKSMSEATFSRMYRSIKIEPTEKAIRVNRLSLVEQFDTLEQYVSLSNRGIIKSLFIYGLAGIGKTEAVSQKLKKIGANFEFFNGGVKDAYSIAKILYDNRENKVLVFDDFDSIFRNKTCIDILKIALADKDKRVITWADSTKRNKKETIPLKFEFTSSVIFISNSPRLDKAIKNRSKIVHIDAEKIECLEWVHSHLGTFAPGIPMNYKNTVYEFIKANIGRFRSMEFRTFKNAMIDFLVCIDERGMSIEDPYWKKMILANAGF